MAKTARHIATANGIEGKTIVLTGSRIPYGEKGSDALFNLGAAIACVQLLPAGVFVCMHGRIFKWNNVVKDLEPEEFRTLAEMKARKTE